MQTKPLSGLNRWAVPAAGTLIAAAAVVAYHNSLSGPFLFDDRLSIRDNPTIRQLWPLWGALAPPSGRGLTVEGRPVLNLSFAVNYAIGGTQVWSYHALNLLIHVLAGLTLFGIVRRTLAGRTRATDCAFMVALLWTVHPVQTESVTYVVQRAESLMGLFYLFTLYAFIRATEPGARVGWAALAVSSCLLGMATKEVMVSAPLIVFLYDRTFVSASFRGAWRRHRGLHLALASTWIVLAWLAAGAGNRGGTSGAGIGVGALTYWESQFQAVARYLWLSVYPQPLIFDYGTEWPQSAWQIVPDAVVVAGPARLRRDGIGVEVPIPERLRHLEFPPCSPRTAAAGPRASLAVDTPQRRGQAARYMAVNNESVAKEDRRGRGLRP